MLTLPWPHVHVTSFIPQRVSNPGQRRNHLMREVDGKTITSNITKITHEMNLMMSNRIVMPEGGIHL